MIPSNVFAVVILPSAATGRVVAGVAGAAAAAAGVVTKAAVAVTVVVTVSTSDPHGSGLAGTDVSCKHNVSVSDC